MITERGGESRRTVLRDAGEADDWAWRRRVRSHRHTLLAYRALIGVLGFVVVAVGVALVPLPGPGWLVVIAGFLIWASEFDWAHHAVQRLKARLSAWNAWVRGRHWLIQGVIGLASLACLVFFLWLTLKISGVPYIVPASVRDWLHEHAAL